MRKKILAAAVVCFLSFAGEVFAEGEILFLFGASISGDISVLNDELSFRDVETAVKESPMFGLRVGSYGFPFGIEGSFTYSPSSLTGGAFNDQIQANVGIFYTEANVLLIILPGPVAPFVSGGAGLHFLDFTIADLVNFDRTKFGYNFGGGLKIAASRLSIRVDVRDHVTTFGLNDLGLGIIGELFGFGQSEGRIHNVELSVGLGVRF
jgi:hypothetical protein